MLYPTAGVFYAQIKRSKSALGGIWGTFGVGAAGSLPSSSSKSITDSSAGTTTAAKQPKVRAPRGDRPSASEVAHSKLVQNCEKGLLDWQHMQESLVRADGVSTVLCKNVTSLSKRFDEFLKAENLPVFALNMTSGEDDTKGIKTMKACQDAERKLPALLEQMTGFHDELVPPDVFLAALNQCISMGINSNPRVIYKYCLRRSAFDVADLDWTAFVENLQDNSEGVNLYAKALGDAGADETARNQEVNKLRIDASTKAVETSLATAWSSIVEWGRVTDLSRVLLSAPWNGNLASLEVELRAGIFLVTLHCKPDGEYSMDEVTSKIDVLEQNSQSVLWKAFNTQPGGQMLLNSAKTFKRQMERDTIVVKKVADSVKSAQAVIPQGNEFYSAGDVQLPGSKRLLDICASVTAAEAKASKSALLLIKKELDILGEYRAAYASNLRAAIKQKFQDNIGVGFAKAAEVLEAERAAGRLDTHPPSSLDPLKEVFQHLKDAVKSFDKYCFGPKSNTTTSATAKTTTTSDFEKLIGADLNIELNEEIRSIKSILKALSASMDELQHWSEDSPVDLESPNLQKLMLTLHLDMSSKSESKSLFFSGAHKLGELLVTALRRFAVCRLTGLVSPYAPIIKQFKDGGTVPKHFFNKDFSPIPKVDFMKIEKTFFSAPSLVAVVSDRQETDESSLNAAAQKTEWQLEFTADLTVMMPAEYGACATHTCALSRWMEICHQLAALSTLVLSAERARSTEDGIKQLLVHKMAIEKYTAAKAAWDAQAKTKRPSSKPQPQQPHPPDPYKAAYVNDAITSLEAIGKLSETIALPRRLRRDSVLVPIQQTIDVALLAYLQKIYTIFVTNFEEACKVFATDFQLSELEALVLSRGDDYPSQVLRDKLMAKCGAMVAKELYIAWNTFKNYMPPLRKLCQTACQLVSGDQLKTLAGATELAANFEQIVKRVGLLLAGHRVIILSQNGHGLAFRPL